MVQNDPELTLELTRIDPRMDPPRLVPRWASDDPPDPQMTRAAYRRVGMTVI